MRIIRAADIQVFWLRLILVRAAAGGAVGIASQSILCLTRWVLMFVFRSLSWDLSIGYWFRLWIDSAHILFLCLTFAVAAVYFSFANLRQTSLCKYHLVIVCKNCRQAFLISKEIRFFRNFLAIPCICVPAFCSSDCSVKISKLATAKLSQTI